MGKGEETVEAFWIRGIINIASTFLLVLLTYGQITNQTVDLAGDEKDRRRLFDKANCATPKKNLLYKCIIWCTTLNLVSSVIFSLGVLYNQFGATSYDSCQRSIAITSSIVVPKYFIYCVFFLRLHDIYQGTKFDWPNVYSYGALITFFYSLLMVIFALFIGVNQAEGESNLGFSIVFQRGDDTDNGIAVCLFDAPTWYILIFAIFDLCMTALFAVCFIYPTKSLLSGKGGFSATLKYATKSQMVKDGVQILILFLVMVGSNIVGAAFYGGAFGGISLNISPLDALINSVCLLLMTSYQDPRVYKCLCRPCNKVFEMIVAGIIKKVTNESEMAEAVKQAQRDKVADETPATPNLNHDDDNKDENPSLGGQGNEAQLRNRKGYSYGSGAGSGSGDDNENVTRIGNSLRDAVQQYEAFGQRGQA